MAEDKFSANRSFPDSVSVRHPLITLRTGAAGRREPCINGTRLYVRQVTSQIRQEGGDVDEVAKYLHMPVSHVQAAHSYYTEFADEIDADQQWVDRMIDIEHARWSTAG